MVGLAAIAKAGKPPPAAVRPWTITARPDQLAPSGDWNIWLLLAGRGWGKTRTGAEWINEQISLHPGTEWGVVAQTFGHARDVCIEGPSGLLATALPGEIVRHVRSLGEIYYANGAKVHACGAEDPDRLRGYNLSGAWADELAAWQHESTWWEGLVPAVRDRRGPCRLVVTTTPKPKPLIRSLLARTDSSVVAVRGSTFDNADNLSSAALAELHARYDGTRLGRQELGGELLDDVEGALWTLALIEASRISETPECDRVVVAIDPAGGSGEQNDETGIVCCAKAGDQFYVLADRSCRASPQSWAERALAAFDEYGADRMVAETNYGGQMVEHTIRSVRPLCPIHVVTASRGKRQRAEPISALYEQGRVHHVGSFDRLEDQMTTWVPDSGRSPDRMDALVWALTDLAESGVRRGPRMTHVSRR